MGIQKLHIIEYVTDIKMIYYNALIFYKQKNYFDYNE